MNPLQVLQLVVDRLEKLTLPYMVAGSFASTVFGELRYTQDADVVVSLGRSSAANLVQSFSPDFYVDRSQIEAAIRRASSFNIIHVESAFKVDLFPLSESAFDQEAFRRRARRLLNSESGFAPYVQTAEDTILAKLRWYRLGGGISDQQWRDVLGILKVQGNALDFAYLRQWAEDLKLADLLEEALADAGPLESA